jgi:hypothetical protein
MGVLVSVRLGMNAIAEIAGQMRAHRDHGHIQHCHVDALPAPGALTLEQAEARAKAVTPVA